MSSRINFLHSHSDLERILKDKDIADKSHVLIDEKYKDMFPEDARKKYKYEKKVYYKVPTLMFFNKGGVFKNLDS